MTAFDDNSFYRRVIKGTGFPAGNSLPHFLPKRFQLLITFGQQISSNVDGFIRGTIETRVHHLFNKPGLRGA